MDYQRIYNELIYSAINDPKLDEYKELHHILPRCMGGTNDKENLVYLTAKQHFISHWLLYRIHRTTKLAHAWYSMCRIGKGQDARRVNSTYYKYAKENRSKHLSIESKGANNHFYGKTHSKETRKKMSVIQKELRLWESFSEEHKSKLLESQKKPKSKEHKIKIGRKGLVMLQNIDTLEIIRVPKSDVRYKDNKWVNPKQITPEQKFKCEWCDVITTKGNLSRWHNQNCKHKKLNP